MSQSDEGGSDGDTQVITPTIAIGIGKGGCRMLSTLHGVAESEGILDDFSFIGIDTNDDELRDNLPRQEENVTTIHLEKPEFWEQDKDDFAYLNDDLLNERSLNNAGVTRTRAVARYHVDSIQNLDTVRTRLEGRIQSFHDRYDEWLDREGGNEINIWLMNSLGGGTGSGSFILLATLIDYITNNTIVGTDAGQFSLMGVGTLPRLDYLETGGGDPEDAEFQANAYAAIRELLVLLGEDNNNSVEIPLEADHEDDIGVLEPRPPVFTRYFLFGGDKDDTGSDKEYTQLLNRAAANIPHYFARLDSQKNFPDGVANLRDEVLWSFNACEVRSPLESIDDYFAIQETIQEIEETIADVETDIGEYENDIEYISDSLEVSLADFREVDAELSDLTIADHVQNGNVELVERCKNKTLGFRMDQFEPDTLEKDIEVINDDFADRTDVLDHEEVVKYYYYQLFAKRLADDMESHPAKETIQQIWADFREQLQDDFPHLTDADPITKWEDGLERFLAERKESLTKKMDNHLSYITPAWWLSWWNLRKINNIQSKGADAYDNYKFLKRATDILEDRYEQSLETLEAALTHYRDELEDLASHKSDLEGQKQQEEQRLSEVIDGLTTHRIDHERLIDLPVRDPDGDLTPQTSGEAESISWFVERGIIAEEDVARALIDVLDERLDEEPLQNLREERDEYARLLAILINEENRHLLETEQGEKNVQDLLNEFRQSQQEEQATVDTHSIWFLGLYTQLVLDNTSEFGAIDDYYRERGDEGVASLFNLSDGAHYMTKRFAHPEFFDEDPHIQEEIQEYFPVH